MVWHHESFRTSLRHRSRFNQILRSPSDDGTYKITGNKIFISSGEHDLTENIIHLVLASIPDSPTGTRGLQCL